MNLNYLTLDELTRLARFQLTKYDNVTKEVAGQFVLRMENTIIPALESLTQLEKHVTLATNEDKTHDRTDDR